MFDNNVLQILASAPEKAESALQNFFSCQNIGVLVGDRSLQIGSSCGSGSVRNINSRVKMWPPCCRQVADRSLADRSVIRR